MVARALTWDMALALTPDQLAWFYAGLERDKAEQRLAALCDLQMAVASAFGGAEAGRAAREYTDQLRAAAGYTDKAPAPPDSDVPTL